MIIEEANHLLTASLGDIYDDRESAAISNLVMEKITGMSKSLRILNKTLEFTIREENQFQQFISELQKGRPVQYVLGEAWFGNMLFFVDESVLIPRPETEELAEWLFKDISESKLSIDILDIGTGSGCLPVYLKKKKNSINMIALDVSSAALDVAKKNSAVHQADIQFLLCDILDRSVWNHLPEVNYIISNPPYIPLKQKAALERHVKDFEPELALFVPDSDPIVFYKFIGELARLIVKTGGAVYLEIHHDYANDVVTWYTENGFIVEIRKDLLGNNRMVKAVNG